MVGSVLLLSLSPLLTDMPLCPPLPSRAPEWTRASHCSWLSPWTLCCQSIGTLGWGGVPLTRCLQSLSLNLELGFF